MFNKLKIKLKKNSEIIALTLLIFVTAISTTYYNYSKKKIIKNYKNTINNVYLKKSFHNLFDNLEPKFKKIHHKISSGQTFEGILERYSIDKNQIREIRNKIS